MRDFTFSVYKRFLILLEKQKYEFITANNWIKYSKAIMLRHDIDSWPKNALQMARIENGLGIRAIYYFRVKKISLDIKILQEIAKLGHEIGYHYEDLCDAKGNKDLAYKRFQSNLAYLREFSKINSIAMHGRPLSKWDSKDIWSQHSYKDLGIEFEPYLDIDYTEVAYLTDTAGRWDGEKYSVRDNVESHFNIQASTTFDLLDLLEKDKLPNKILINVHPARWNDNIFVWSFKKYILTDSKLMIKSQLKKFRKRKNERL